MRTIVDQLDVILEKIHSINSELYKKRLKQMDVEELHEEFNSKIGSELREFEYLLEHRGMEFIVEYLCDHYNAMTYEKMIGGAR